MVNHSMSKPFQGKGKQDQSLHVLDILRYLLSNWKWFLLSILLFGGYYYYQYSKTPFLYKKDQTVMIKTANNSISASRITRPNNFYNFVNVNSEILQLRSQELMRNTISLLNADVSYGRKDGLRSVELYKTSPFIVRFVNVPSNAGFSFNLKYKGNNQVELSGFSNDELAKPIIVKLNAETKTPVGNVIISANPDKKFRVNLTEDITITKTPINAMVGYFLGNLKITQMEDVEVLQMTMEDTSPMRAEEMISKLIEVYNEMTVQDKKKIANNTANFINDRLVIIEKELSSVESDLEGMKTQNQGLDVKSAGEQYWTESRGYQSSSKELGTQMKLVEIMRQRLSDPSRVDDLIPSNTGLVDGSIEEIIAEYNTLLLRRNRLMSGNSSENPIVQDLNNALTQVRQNIARAIDNVISGLRIRMSNLREEENAAIGKARSLPSKQRIMLSAERQQKVIEELYIFLLNKREENAINREMTDDNIRVIDSASGSDLPFYPSKFKKIALGVAIGIAVPAAILLLMLLLNTKVRNRKDVEDAISVPFVGEIPFSTEMKSAKSEIVIKEQGVDEVTEAFRIFRTNLSFMSSGDKSQKVITFTSFNVGAGKTFSVINLGVSMTFLKKKVVLVDLDLRKGTLSNITKFPMPIGVTHYLSDSAVTIDEIIYKDRVDADIDIIPIGVIAPNPVELLLSERLDNLIAELKERYDYIIVDNVPLGIVADADIVNRITDVTIFVVRAGKMDRRQLPEIQKIYDSGSLTNMAIVLNGVKFGNTGYGSYGYGYGGYGYGYGYGYGAQKKKGFFSKLFGRN
jgi:capsular exopolysaccharide synthesis family protein